MRKLLIALLVLVSIFAFVSCDDSKNVPEEITVSTWDGTTADTTWYKADTKEYTLTEASQLAGLAELVNDGNALSGVTINLGNNINLNDKQWTPIGLYKDANGTSNKKPFSGTFDGKNHYIAGLKIDCEDAASSYRALFGYVKDGTVKNFTVRGEVKACDASGVVAALEDGTIDNVVSYVNVSTSQPYTSGSNKHTKVAGIVVATKEGTNGCTIKNSTNYGTIKSTAADADDAIGGIVAWSKVKSLTIENCKNAGDVSTTSSKQFVGGIIGCVDKSETSTLIKNCENTGKVSSSKDKGVGEIVGWIYSGAKGKIVDCTPSDATKQIGSGTFTAPSTES